MVKVFLLNILLVFLSRGGGLEVGLSVVRRPHRGLVRSRDDVVFEKKPSSAPGKSLI